MIKQLFFITFKLEANEILSSMTCKYHSTANGAREIKKMKQLSQESKFFCAFCGKREGISINNFPVFFLLVSYEIHFPSNKLIEFEVSSIFLHFP